MNGLDTILQLVTLFSAILGPVAAVGTLYAVLTRVRSDLAEHLAADNREFTAIRGEFKQTHEHIADLRVDLAGRRDGGR